MEKFTIIITEPIYQAGVDLLKGKNFNVIELPLGSTGEDLIQIIDQADALITRGGIKITREIMASSTKLKAVGVHGIGCDHVDLNAAKELGKVVLNTPTALTATVAEMTIALLLALTRRVVSADKAVRAGEWNRKYSDLIGKELWGKTVGIIGLGNIGIAVARRLKSFEVELLYVDIRKRLDIEDELGIKRVELKELLESSDIVTIHVPYSSATHHLISAEKLELMKKGAYIINTSRGKVIDQEALIEALIKDKLSGAALDVFENEPLNQESPLMTMDNVILTPHLGAGSMEAMRRLALQVADGVMKVIYGESPDHPVVL